MPILSVILLILFLGSLATLLLLFFKKLPQLRLIDPSTSKDAVSRQLKYDIIRKRVERAGEKPASAVKDKVVTPIGKGLQFVVRSIAGKLTAVERSYQERQKQGSTGKLSKDALDELLKEGKKLLEEENWDRAEKTFIEIISNDPRNTNAYEFLGRLYMKKRDLKSAKQTFLFLKKLNPKDASVLVNLGEVEEQAGDMEKAYEWYKSAIEISPKNPKYLDFFINAAIEKKDVVEAQTALKTLKNVNPENKKIETYEARVKKVIEVAKTEPKKKAK